MKWKLAMILMSLVASSAFVAPTPAQQTVGQPVFRVTTPAEPPQPPSVPPPPLGVNTTVNPNRYYYVEPGVTRPFVARWNVVPDEANLVQETDLLARQLGEAKSDTDRDKIKTKLGEVLAKQFDQRQKRHEHEIEELEAQVKKLKDLVSKRQENRREIIAQRLDQIIRESQGLGW